MKTFRCTVPVILLLLTALLPFMEGRRFNFPVRATTDYGIRGPKASAAPSLTPSSSSGGDYTNSQQQSSSKNSATSSSSSSNSPNPSLGRKAPKQQAGSIKSSSSTKSKSHRHHNQQHCREDNYNCDLTVQGHNNFVTLSGGGARLHDNAPKNAVPIVCCETKLDDDESNCNTNTSAVLTRLFECTTCDECIFPQHVDSLCCESECGQNEMCCKCTESSYVCIACGGEDGGGGASSCDVACNNNNNVTDDTTSTTSIPPAFNTTIGPTTTTVAVDTTTSPTETTMTTTPVVTTSPSVSIPANPETPPILNNDEECPLWTTDAPLCLYENTMGVETFETIGVCCKQNGQSTCTSCDECDYPAIVNQACCENAAFDHNSEVTQVNCNYCCKCAATDNEEYASYRCVDDPADCDTCLPWCTDSATGIDGLCAPFCQNACLSLLQEKCGCAFTSQDHVTPEMWADIQLMCTGHDNYVGNLDCWVEDQCCTLNDISCADAEATFPIFCE